MFGLHKAFERTISRRIRAENVLLTVVREKFENLGVRLNASQVKLLRKQLKAANPTIGVQVTDDQIAHARIKSEADLEKALIEALSNISSEVTSLWNKMMGRLPKMMEKAAESAADSIFRKIRRTYRYGLKDRHEIQAHFESDLQRTWSKPISQLEVLLALCLEAGEEMLKLVTKGRASVSEVKWTVLSHLHARACQIGAEIVTLLKAGYADGAHARWRSLHEVAVVATFIHDHDDRVAEHYLLHDVIEEYKSVAQQLDACSDLSADPDFSSYLCGLQEQKNDLAKKYGKLFCEDYGWAICALANPRPTFKNIEKEVNLSHFRSYYREASHNVHANARGTFSRLGLCAAPDDVLLAGASHFGLADPGHLAALSLTQVTASILLPENAIMDAVVFMKVILKQRDMVGTEFWRIHRRILKNVQRHSIEADGQV